MSVNSYTVSALQTNGPILKISRDIDQVDARHAKDAPEDVDSQESGFEALEDDPVRTRYCTFLSGLL